MNWDYIVVGAGSAGCAVASRLSEDPSNRVLLLDAGGRDWSAAIHVPAGIIFGRNRYDWSYPGEPDASRGGIEDVWSAGNTFGGSSAINGMMYVRGNALDFDSWAQAGCDGWDYKSVLPYFRRMETWEDGESEWRGGDGPVHIVRDPVRHPLAEAFIEAASESGYPINDDYNGRQQDGVAVVQANQRCGLRHTAARAYLGWGRRRANLRIIQRSRVDKILFDGNRAIGVRYTRGDRVEEARCRREVVVSAGALISPKLLMLSGIGEASQLQEFGIETLCDRPGVGRNLQEHAVTALSFEAGVRTLNTEKVFSLRAIGHAYNYLFHHRGPLAASVGAAQLFCKSNAAEPRPDLQVIFVPMGYKFVETKTTVELQMHPKPHMTVAITALHTKNRGSIRLRSADPEDNPRIHFELLGTDDVIEKLMAGCRIVRAISGKQALQQFIVEESLPGVALETVDEEGWEEYLREGSYRGDHPCGTCKMGGKDDPLAVVDPELRVIGVDGLRVADASVMPTVVSGNTNAAVMMIGEHAADLIARSR
ncbi:MAG: GMC family oxidoreductase N-terminal domain-containing protein [Woeseiaceae bacterium]